MAETVLIAGGTGLVGTRLTELLLEKNYEVRHLSRTVKGNETVPTYPWSVDEQEIDPEALKGINHVVHLAGAGVADERWTDSRKQLILDSRVDSTALLIQGIKEHNPKIKSFIAASAIGIYGSDTGHETITEGSKPGKDFLARVTVKWEAASDPLKEMGIRLVKLRIGIVLSTAGGALPKLIQPIKLGMATALGSGKQYMSWIHIDDLCRMFIHAIEHEQLQGAYNAVGPKPVNNETMTRSIAKLLDRPMFLPNAPGFALRLAMGEMASIVLGGNKVSSRVIEDTGFIFEYPDHKSALKSLLNVE